MTTATAAACTVCDRPAEAVVRDQMEIAAELRTRDRFFAVRLARPFDRDELRDVTNVTLGTPAAILRCVHCGVLIRDDAPGDDVFREDRYTTDSLQRLHETHVRAFRQKEPDYRPLLPPHAQVIEIGSYAGGFLAVAAEWGWSAIGYDIGRDPVRFCRTLGFDARCEELHDCALEADALFIWNCFEQIERPHELLDDAHRVLRAEGLLVIRIPDADFYVRCKREALLAYNNLLGWPHRYGYDAITLRRLAEQHGFTFVRALRRAAMRPLREAMHPWARNEEAAMLGDVHHGWIELAFRPGS